MARVFALHAVQGMQDGKTGKHHSSAEDVGHCPVSVEQNITIWILHACMSC